MGMGYELMVFKSNLVRRCYIGQLGNKRELMNCRLERDVGVPASVRVEVFNKEPKNNGRLFV